MMTELISLLILKKRKSLLTIIIADNIDFEHGEMSKIKLKRRRKLTDSSIKFYTILLNY